MQLLKRLKKAISPKIDKTPLETYLNAYDSDSLSAMITSMGDSLAWQIFSAYLRKRQREFEVAALDLSCQDGHTLRGAKASGIACGLEEVADKLIPEFINYVKGQTGVIETPRPE